VKLGKCLGFFTNNNPNNKGVSSHLSMKEGLFVGFICHIKISQAKMPLARLFVHLENAQ
jgi:hypothetical protein